MDFLKNNRLLSWGVFALVVFIVFYYFGSRTGKRKQTQAADPYKTGTTANALTYDLANYASLADRLESAMYGFTDDEEAIYAVFSKLRNQSDLYQLITAFGSRRPIWHIGTADLATWLNTRLDTPEIQKINEILARNNISFQF